MKWIQKPINISYIIIGILTCVITVLTLEVKPKNTVVSQDINKIVFKNEAMEFIGELTCSGNVISFTGNADSSATTFFENYLKKNIDAYYTIKEGNKLFHPIQVTDGQLFNNNKRYWFYVGGNFRELK